MTLDKDAHEDGDNENIENETNRDQATSKALAIKELMLEHKKEVESLLVEQEEEWFTDDPFLTITFENMEIEEHRKGEEKVYGASIQLHEYGVYSDEWWIGTSRAMLAIVYTILFALVGIVAWQFMYYSYQEHVIAWVIGALFVALAVPLSLQDIHYHILHYVSPLQRHYIRILWMVPIYSVESWLALRFNEQKMYLETLREAYESYVVYSLFKLMREFLGKKEEAVLKLQKLGSKKGKTEAVCPWPLCCIKWKLNAQFLTRSAVGVWQYVFTRTLLAVLACIFEKYHMYGEGTMDFSKLYIYNVLILNTSQMWALCCLIFFYHELKDELAPINPLGKFLIVKAVVFFSWWQQILITMAASFELVHPLLDYSAEDVSKGLQNLIIVVEMLVYAICHKFIFSYTDFRAGGPLQQYLDETRAARKQTKEAMRDMLPTDVIMEGGEYIKKAKRFVKKKVTKEDDAV